MNFNEIPKQTEFVDFANRNDKKAGDCWRCCIAAVVGLPAESVPHFLQIDLDTRGTDGHKDCDSLTQQWLLERGFMLVRGNFYFDYTWGDDRADFPIIKCGPTPRSKRMHQHHAVVYIRDEMVYDPHPDNSGLTAITDTYIVIRVVKG